MEIKKEYFKTYITDGPLYNHTSIQHIKYF